MGAHAAVEWPTLDPAGQWRTSSEPSCWVAVKELDITYHDSETIIFGIYIYIYILW